jgi:hypothetical protein
MPEPFQVYLATKNIIGDNFFGGGGVKMANITYQNQKKELLEILSPDEVKTLQKGNPLKLERNKKIYEFFQKGVSTILLADITGMTPTSINNIGQHGHNYQIATRRDRKKQLEVLTEMEEVFNVFAIRFGQILKCRR